MNPISCSIPAVPPAYQLDILGALTQTGITQTAAGGKARAFCDIVGDQLGTMETNEFLNLGQTPVHIATSCSYNVNMEVGIRDAKTKLSKLVEAVLDGQEVFLTNRGARVVQLVRTPKAPTQGRGRGAWKGKIHLYDGWDSRDEDKRIEEMFQTLHEAGPK
jgi:prevent-host-death family protein